MPTRINRKASAVVAAHGVAQQAETIVSLDRGADQLDAIAHREWGRLLRVLKPGHGHYHANHVAILAAFAAIQRQQAEAARKFFTRVATKAGKQAAGTLARTLRPALAKIARPTRESVTIGGDTVFPDWLGEEPPTVDEIADLLFDPPPESWIDDILSHSGLGRHAPPAELAGAVATTLARGGSTRDAARELLPMFDGNRKQAMRSARTFGIYVANERNLAAAEELGDLVSGYQVHSAGGENARPDHLRRSGAIYYRRPNRGQLSMDQMPHPPVDYTTADGSEGTGIKWHCRCWMTPVIDLEGAALMVGNEPGVTTFESREHNGDDLHPDFDTLAEWWQGADTHHRRALVGERRLSAGGYDSEWGRFADSATGRMLTAWEIAGGRRTFSNKITAKI